MRREKRKGVTWGESCGERDRNAEIEAKRVRKQRDLEACDTQRN